MKNKTFLNFLKYLFRLPLAMSLYYFLPIKNVQLPGSYVKVGHVDFAGKYNHTYLTTKSTGFYS